MNYSQPMISDFPYSNPVTKIACAVGVLYVGYMAIRTTKVGDDITPVRRKNRKGVMDGAIDKAIDKNILKNDVLAITQFGTNLKAAVLGKECYPSGGVVVVSHDGLSIDEAKDYLNESYINYYLKRYVLNNADLTVHLDGVYLKEIPYNILNK